MTAGGPSVGLLQKDDIITSVDGTTVTSPSKLTELIRAQAGRLETDHRLHPGQ